MEYIPVAIQMLLSYGLYLVIDKQRKVISILLIIVPIAITLTSFNNLTLLAVATSLVLLTSHGRIFMSRYGKKREKRILFRTWRVLALTLLLVYLIQLAGDQLGKERISGFIAITILIFCMRAAVLSIYRAYKYSYKSDNYEGALPTVTLAIPARNETHALTDSLRSAVAIQYPKLEILVLDDCSQDSTPQIIRSFAHDGIRFIQGKDPSSSWLGKNYAYEKLLEEASGELVIFCGVDVHFTENSVRKIVNTMSSRKMNVMSIMPTRRNFDLLPSLFRSIRYHWELAFSFWPNMNSCWVARRDWLEDKDGFKQYKHSIQPEREIALNAKVEGTYKFVVSNNELGITTRKRLSSELETMTRTIYPRMHRELMYVFIAVSLGLLGTFTLTSVITPISGDGILFIQIAAIYLWFSFLVSEYVLQPKYWIISALLAPVNLLSTSVTGVLSLVKYEYGSVDWKGRNVCLPTMQQISKNDGASVFQARSRSSNKK